MRRLIACTLIVLCLFLTGCTLWGSISTNKNFINEAQLTEREKSFLSIGNEHYLVFDFNAEDYQWIEVSIDKFEFGEKVMENPILSMGLDMGQSGTIIGKINREGSSLNWVVALNSKGGLGSGKAIYESVFDEDIAYLEVYRINYTKKINIEVERDMILGVIGFKDQGRDNTARANFSTEFFNSPEENIEEIKDFDMIYIFKCKFYDSMPKFN